MCVCVHVFVPAYTPVSMCEGEKEGQAKLTIVSRFGVPSTRVQDDPMADKWNPSHHHASGTCREFWLPVLTTLGPPDSQGGNTLLPGDDAV